MEIKRILVSRTDKIGDLILSIPSFFIEKEKASRKLLALIDGATSWTRTSDPHHVKVVL